MQKMTMQTRQNALCWNPMEPFHFTTASEDHDLYTFDMRRLDHAICVHKGCVSAALTLTLTLTLPRTLPLPLTLTLTRRRRWVWARTPIQDS